MAVSGTNIFAGADGEGIFRSTDSGKSWIVANTGLPNITISSLLASGSNLYAGTNGDGVYLSTNEGVSWSATGSITGGFVNALAESNANLFAGTDAGASLSKNDGITWTTINTGLVNTGIGLLASIGDNLYAATTYGVFRTTDNGLSWIAQNNGLKSIDVHALAVNDTNLLAGTSAGVWRLTASSVSWSNAGLTGNYIGALAETGNSLYAGTDNSSQPSGGVYLSTDKGTNWTATSNGLPSDIAVYGLAAIGTNLFVDFIIPEPNQVEQIYVSTDSGANWASTGFSSGVGPSAAISDNLFVTWNNNGVFRSTDDGISWSSVNTGLTDRKVYALLVSGTTLFAGTNSGLFFSTDNGDDWTMANSGLMTAIYAIAATTSNLFVGAVSGVWRRPLSDFSAVTTVNPTKPSFTTYPNPFSNRTTINFTSTESGVVEISIVNILGAEVARLFSGELAAGAHSYSWNADGMPAGSYFCILRSSKGVQELPIALLR
jgi:ligand-binding sensor domain-containing protein